MEKETITYSNLMQQDEFKTSHSFLLDVNQSSAFAITSVIQDEIADADAAIVQVRMQFINKLQASLSSDASA